MRIIPVNFGNLNTSKNLILVKNSLSILPKSDKKKLALVTAIQSGFGFLDLMGVAAIGIIGSLSITGIQSRNPGGRVSEIVNFLKIDGYSFQMQVAILGSIATGLLLFRTLLSIFTTRKILFFLSRRSAAYSSELISRLLTQDLTVVQARTTQETLFSVTTGVNSIIVGVVGTLITLFSDLATLLIIFIGLLIVNSALALGTLILFGGVAALLYKLMHVRAENLGVINSKLTIESFEKILEALGSYRELVVRNRRQYYSKEISKTRMSLANNSAEMAFLPNIGKYTIEITIVIGALVISALQFILQDAAHAIATLTIFIAAGSRIAPAVLRIQQSAVAIKGSFGAAQPTVDLMHELQELSLPSENYSNINFNYPGFASDVSFKDVVFAYSGSSQIALNNVSFDVSPGEVIAIVGSSGAGKTTLVDILLGVLTPNSGAVMISNSRPIDAISKWPGAISYVPQDVVIIDGTIRENIVLGYPHDFFSDDQIWKSLDTANLMEFVLTLEGKLNAQAGEKGIRMSGGQRQRLGIARALITSPKLLVLDEATSSLDGRTESDISQAIQELRGSVTTILIAHRISTVKSADRLIYLEQGMVRGVGTFDELRKNIKEFDEQVLATGMA